MQKWLTKGFQPFIQCHTLYDWVLYFSTDLSKKKIVVVPGWLVVPLIIPRDLIVVRSSELEWMMTGGKRMKNVINSWLRPRVRDCVKTIWAWDQRGIIISYFKIHFNSDISALTLRRRKQTRWKEMLLDKA